MNYEIVCANHPSEMEEKVRSKIADGWTPLGGISTPDGEWFCQAMTRQDDNKEDAKP